MSIKELVRYVELINKLMNRFVSRCGETNELYNQITSIVIHEAREAIQNISLNHIIDFMRNLKVIFEASIMMLYYHARYGNDFESMMREYRRRIKAAVIFNIKMISKIPDLHRVIKNEILRAYLRLSAYSHPTNELLALYRDKVGEHIRELEKDVTDKVVYLLLRICDKEILDEHIINEIKELMLVRSLRYLSRSAN